MGTCLLGASSPPPSTSASLLAFYGTPVVYASEQSVLSDRSILPDPGPPKTDRLNPTSPAMRREVTALDRVRRSL
jgi:hypothetical protein